MKRENIDEDLITILGGLIFFIIGIVLTIVASFYLLGGVVVFLPHRFLGLLLAFIPLLVIGIFGIIDGLYLMFIRLEKKENTLGKVLSFIKINYKFLLTPGSRLEELSNREYEYEKQISQRKFISRLIAPLTIVGIVIIFYVITLVVFSAWIAPYSIEIANGIFVDAWGAPAPDHILGQGKYGRDVLSRLIYGARSSITIALPSIALSVILGVVFGVIGGYYGGIIDSAMMRIFDIILSFPGLILVMVVVAIRGEPRIEDIMLAYGFLGIPYYSRLIRGQVLQARELPYIQAARTSGAGSFKLMFKHILPNSIQPIIIAFTFNIGGIILSLAGLAFLGFSDPDLIEWGNDIAQARLKLYDAPWAAMWPGFMILITVLGFMLLGDGLRDALDPRMKNL